MREIKFRAWDKDAKKMCEDFLYFVEDAIYQHQGNPWQDERFTLMQFTGLKDKNGKEIYEGDIILLHPTDKHGVKVSWDEDIAGFGFKGQAMATHLNSPKLSAENYTVIGNIYENPDMLKV
jgi:uncharacterized phage protein (TIGR01671 family)